MLKSAKGIGELIYYYRLVKNLSQQELSEKLHVTVSAISSWERGINKPGVEIAAVLAEDMGITLDDFFRIKDKPSLEKPLKLNETYAFEKTFVRINRMKLHPQTGNLIIRFIFWGVSIDKESLTKTLDINYICNQRKCKIIGSDIHVLETAPSTLSPEFKNLPSLSKKIETEHEIDYIFNHDLEVRIRMIDEEVAYCLPGELIQMIVKSPIIDVDDLMHSQEKLKSETFRMTLEYYANIHDYKGLQAYLVKQFSSITPYIKYPNSNP